MGTGKRGVLHRHVYAINGWSNIDWPCPVMIIISRLINLSNDDDWFPAYCYSLASLPSSMWCLVGWELDYRLFPVLNQPDCQKLFSSILIIPSMEKADPNAPILTSIAGPCILNGFFKPPLQVTLTQADCHSNQP